MTRWVHKADTAEILSEDAGRAVAVAQAHGWSEPAMNEQVDYLRAYLAVSAATAAHFGGTVRVNGPADVDPRVTQGGERGELARTLVFTPALIGARALADGVPRDTTLDLLETEHGWTEVGFAPVVAAAIAVAGLGMAAAYAYVAHQAAQVIDRALARHENTARLVEVDSRLLELAAQHAEAERKAGKALPLNAATKAAVAALQSTQKELVAREPELKSGLENLGAKLPWAGAAGGFTVGLAVAALVAIYLLK